jgi:hypothetical protein
MYLFVFAYLILFLSLFMTIYDEQFDIPSGQLSYNSLSNAPPAFNPANGVNAGTANVTCGSLNVNGQATCQTLSISSDRRIKQNIQPLTGETSLDLLNRMNPVRYQWKDTRKEVYGFIAQDLKDCLPTAVMSQKGVIHNIFQEANCEGNILTFTDFNTSDLSYDTENKLFPLHIDEATANIVEILDESSVRLDKDMNATVFVKGQEVDDFHTIDNHQIFTVTTSAVQELDRKVQRLEEENKALQQQVAQLVELLKNL